MLKERIITAVLLAAALLTVLFFAHADVGVVLFALLLLVAAWEWAGLAQAPRAVHRAAFTLLIAVLLSAQCTDVRVNLVTPKLFARARTPQKMSRLPVDQIEEIVRPCGLAPAKSKNISKLSQILGQ